jgi:hypothetical protein
LGALLRSKRTHRGGKTVNNVCKSVVLFLEDDAPEFCSDESFNR